jgi:hypothetical protein
VNKKITALVVGAAAVLTACSTVSTSASELALQYGGGMWDSENFVSCFNPGYKSTTNSGGDTYKYYPVGQRDFSFGDDKGLDSAALTATTQDTQAIKVTGTVKFTMNISCTPFTDPTGKKWPGGTAQYFHEIYGSKDGAFNEDGNQPTSAGWSSMLRQYMGFAVDREVDDGSITLTLNDLITSAAKKDAWENSVQESLPRTLKQLTGGVEIFRITEVLLQRPGVSPKIADAQDEKAAAVIRAQAADVDKKAAANFPGGVAGYQAYQQQQAINEAIKSGKVKVIPIPAGSPVIVNPEGN